MNERDIQLAKQALKHPDTDNDGLTVFDNDELKKLIDLIRADERERIKAANAPEIERINAHLKSLEDAAQAEREACAKVCESYAAANTSWTKAAVNDCATAIRAKGKA